MSDGDFQTPHPIESYGLMIMDLSDAKETIEIHRLKNKEAMNGAELIAQERLEHKIRHGYSVKSDFENNMDNQLSQAAAALIEGDINWMPDTWDEAACKRMIKKPWRERLIIAGALIAAEIDRLDFEKELNSKG